MIFKSISPSEKVARIVERYWIVDGDRPPHQEKIIPDGFTEIIFHLGDPYKTNVHGKWETQSRSLLAGQIKKYFFLKNTGKAFIVGIKFKPTALTHLFGLDMHIFTDKVVPLQQAPHRLVEMEEAIRNENHNDGKIKIIESHLLQILETIPLTQNSVDEAVGLILNKKGMITVKEICQHLRVSERHLERMFKKFVGLSPKFYARIIRFNTIFQLIHESNPSWHDVVYQAGFYDQPHFIRNFKSFTGEDPAAYIFNEPNLANFFLRKV